ncbi:putative lumazine-binding protein [Chitinophaga skermanii]|uniref:Putative lumazine-binding protein n=1 Tax=Chitinophaga skermanii TaxID=331697 RepID=A0A327QE05_9BACT|nr:nuclear transport factor 2 family protein [Chitinophaga skermanii]RAJ02235.1 putative lumazine-binding protein [Chitinophaga skermanii]
MKKLFFISFFLVALVSAKPMQAQTADHEQVKAVIQQLFEGMRKGDSTLVKASFADDAILQTIVRKKDGTDAVRTEALANFLKAVGTPHTDVWDERIVFDQVLIDGPLASAWTPYKFYIGDKFSHCGANSFQLARTPAGWKIVYLIDSRRKEGCEAIAVK